MEELTLKSQSEERQLAMKLEAEEIKRGQVLAFCCVLLFFALAAMALYFNHPWAASFLGLGGVGGIVSSFIVGRRTHPDRALSQQLNESKVGKP